MITRCSRGSRFLVSLSRRAGVADVYVRLCNRTLKPFKYDIRPRSAQAVKLVREAKGLSD